METHPSCQRLRLLRRGGRRLPCLELALHEYLPNAFEFLYSRRVSWCRKREVLSREVGQGVVQGSGHPRPRGESNNSSGVGMKSSHRYSVPCTISTVTPLYQ